MRPVIVLLLSALALASLCIGDRYAYVADIYVFIFDMTQGHFATVKLHLPSETNMATVIGADRCPVAGDRLFLGLRNASGDFLLRIGVGGVEKGIKINGELAQVAPVCGGIAALVLNTSHVAVQWLTSELEIQWAASWEREGPDARYDIVGSGCELWLLEYHAEGTLTNFYIVAPNGTRELVYTAEELVYVLPDRSGGLHFFSTSRWVRITKGGAALLGSGINGTPYAGFVKGDYVYLLYSLYTEASAYVVVKRPFSGEERIYLGRRYVLMNSDGEFIYDQTLGFIRRYRYIPNGTLIVRTDVGDVFGLRVGIAGVGEAEGGVYGPVKVWPGAYEVYVRSCHERRSHVAEVSDGGIVEKVIDIEGGVLRIQLVDFFRRPVAEDIYVKVKGREGSCIQKLVKSPVEFFLPSGRYYVSVRFYKHGGSPSYREELSAGVLDVPVDVDGAGRAHLNYGTVERLFMMWDNTMYIYRDGITYLEIITIIIILGILYLMEKTANILRRRG